MYILYYILVMNKNQICFHFDIKKGIFLLISVKKKASHIKSSLIQCCKIIKLENGWDVNASFFICTECNHSLPSATLHGNSTGEEEHGWPSPE